MDWRRLWPVAFTVGGVLMLAAVFLLLAPITSNSRSCGTLVATVDPGPFVSCSGARTSRGAVVVVVGLVGLGLTVGASSAMWSLRDADYDDEDKRRRIVV